MTTMGRFNNGTMSYIDWSRAVGAFASQNVSQYKLCLHLLAVDHKTNTFTFTLIFTSECECFMIFESLRLLGRNVVVKKHTSIHKQNTNQSNQYLFL